MNRRSLLAAMCGATVAPSVKAAPRGPVAPMRARLPSDYADAQRMFNYHRSVMTEVLSLTQKSPGPRWGKK